MQRAPTHLFAAAIACSLIACTSEPAALTRETGTPDARPTAGAPERVAAERASRPTPATPEGRWSDLGQHHRRVTTTSPEAQRWFDQGLVLLFGFDHDQAIEAFEAATGEDPGCAMAWWGIAYANGPHINRPVMTPQRTQAALAALERARAAEHASDVERALIEALARRHEPGEAAQDRARLDRAYVDALRPVWLAHGDDADVGALFAEAIMNLHPWDLWSVDGQPDPDAPEVERTLEAVIALNAEHPAGNHFYVHALEASPYPERALLAADRLRTLAPGASHLVHMPAHIDVRVGDYEAAAEANRKAILADEVHRESTAPAGFFQIYMAHNWHFLAFAELMQGRLRESLGAARALAATIPPEALRDPEAGAFLDSLMPTTLHVLVRFGQWEQLLREPPYPDTLPVSQAVWHHARGTALAALGRLDEAEAELQALREKTATIDPERPMSLNPAQVVLQIPIKTLEGEILYRRGLVDEGIAALREAVALQSRFQYIEPPDWMEEARHPLAATLMAAGRFDEAEPVLREDLKEFPENGWSLVGLAECLRARGADVEADDVDARFRRAWARADTPISSPCLCQPIR